MKKKIVIACTAGSLLIILDSMNAGQMFLLFLFNGIIPGTNYALSPTIMLSIMIALGSVCIIKFAIKPLKQKYAEIEKASQTSHRKLKHA